MFVNNLTFCIVTFKPFDINALGILMIILGLLIISAFNSAAETAFFSFSPNNLDEIKEESQDNTTYKRILNLLKNPEKLLATVLLSNDLCNIAVAVLSAIFLTMIVDFGDSFLLEFVIQTIVITFIILLFAEIIPKIYASQNPLKVASFSATPLTAIDKILSPISTLLVKSTSIVHKRLKKNHQTISVDELSQALDLTNHIEGEQDILRGIVEFGNLSVDSIMTPRIDVVAINIKTLFSDVVKKIIDTGYSRIPVYEKSLDQIVGVLYIKDLIAHINKSDTFRWQTLIRPATFIPETRKIDDLLLDFQKHKVHIAIVVDEFGGTLGIITMEDIMEEIIGDIADEYDEDNKQYEKIDDKTYEFEGKILLNDFYKILDISPDEFDHLTNEVDTLAGLILEMFEEMPHVSEHVSYKNYTFTIIALEKRRIKRIKLEIE